MEHTPGPWVTSYRHIPSSDKAEWWILDSFQYPIASSGVGPHAFNTANARLIAAAPHMHDELGIIGDIAHRAANGSLKRPGKPARVSDLIAMLRRIRDIASAATEKAS